MRWWRDRAQAELEEPDDRWGPPVSRLGEGRRQREVGQQPGRVPPKHGRLGRLRGQCLVGRGRATGWGRKKEVGHGWAKNRSWAQFK
jgi:hypothetical protein